MTAYNKIWLDNLLIRNVCDDAKHENLLESDEVKNIHEAYPVGFYTPNIFIRCGLFLLTIVVGLCTFGLLCLIFIDSIDEAINGIAIFFGLLTYAGAEMYVRFRHHYRSGVLEALLWSSALALFGGFSNLLSLGDTGNCVLLYLITAWYSLRFADIVSSIAAFLSFLGIFLFASVYLGETTTSFAPFLLMICSCATYVLIKQSGNKKRLRHYKDCMTGVEIFSLMALYASGNYFIIESFNASLLVQDIAPVTQVPFGLIFWISTVVIPPANIVVGLFKKDSLLFRVGLILLVALELTVTHYRFIAPVEMLMTIGGLILLGVSWRLSRYLKQPKHGYTSEKTGDQSFAASQIESIVIAETFAAKPDDNQGKFGGGSFGGAGAGSDY